MNSPPYSVRNNSNLKAFSAPEKDYKMFTDILFVKLI